MTKINCFIYGLSIGLLLMFLLTVKQEKICQVVQSPVVQFFLK